MDISKRIKKLIKEKLDPNKKVSDSSSLGSLGADSLDVIEIIMEVENELDIEIDDILVGVDTKVSELIEIIEDTYRNNLTKNLNYENNGEKHNITLKLKYNRPITSQGVVVLVGDTKVIFNKKEVSLEDVVYFYRKLGKCLGTFPGVEL